MYSLYTAKVDLGKVQHGCISAVFTLDSMTTAGQTAHETFLPLPTPTGDFYITSLTTTLYKPPCKVDALPVN